MQKLTGEIKHGRFIPDSSCASLFGLIDGFEYPIFPDRPTREQLYRQSKASVTPSDAPFDPTDWKDQ